MILILADGSEVECLDNSFDGELYVKGNLETVSMAMGLITNSNLKRAELGGTITIINKVIDRATFTAPDSEGEILLIYYLRDKSDVEELQDRVDEQDAALMELAELITG